MTTAAQVPELQELGAMIRKARLAANMSQETLGGVVGIGGVGSYLSRVEHRKRAPNEPHLVKIAEELGLDAQHLLDLRKRAVRRRWERRWGKGKEPLPAAEAPEPPEGVREQGPGYSGRYDRDLFSTPSEYDAIMAKLSPQRRRRVEETALRLARAEQIEQERGSADRGGAR